MSFPRAEPAHSFQSSPAAAELLPQLAEIAAAAQRARTVKAVLTTAGEGLWQIGLRLVVTQMEGNVGSLRYACDPKGELAWLETVLGYPLRNVKGAVDPGGPSVRSLAEGRTLFIDNLALRWADFLHREAGLDEGVTRAALLRGGFERAVLVPVTVRGAPWGTILVCSNEITGDHGRALSLFGAQLGSAIETADTIEMLERRTLEQEALRAVATADSSKGLDRLASELVALVAKVTQSDFGIIYLLDEVAGRLTMLGTPFGRSDPGLRERYLRMPASATHTGQTALSQQARAVSLSQLSVEIGEDLGRYGFQEFCMAPFSSGRSKGTINVVRTRPDHYTREEARFTEILAAQIGVQLENARLYSEQRLRVEELKASYDRLERTQQELVRHERLAALGELSAAMAHELRNALGAIFNSLSSLRRVSPKDSKAVLFEKIIAEEADRLNRIVGDLLDFARPYNAELVSVQLDTFIASVLEAVAQPAREVAVELVLELAAGLPEVRLDPRLLRQALVNLLVNAVQATARAGRVTLKAALAREGGQASLHLDVVDEGIGVAPELRERIFQPFFTTKPTGTGLGLAVVKRILEAHGGTVELLPTAVPGATFRLSVPVASSQRPA